MDTNAHLVILSMEGGWVVWDTVAEKPLIATHRLALALLISMHPQIAKRWLKNEDIC